MPAKTNLSGRAWWKANQARHPNSRDLQDLEPGFRQRVELFIAALRSGGASVSVGSTRRDPNRAYLMHFSWKLANGMIRAADVPPRSGVEIDWDHGDETRSRTAAMEMVHAASMVHMASLTSNHTRGTAIDMTLAWKGTLVLKLPGSFNLWEIPGRPRDGSNRELNQLAADVFGVKKLRSDPPHWSHNGK